MITLPSARDQKKVMDAVEEASKPGGTQYRARLGFYIGGEDYTGDLLIAEWGQQEIPITLDADLSGYIPLRLQTERTLFVIEVEGVSIPQLYGEKTMVRPGENAYETNLLSSSAGALLTSDDAVTLNSYTEYPSVAPERVVWDVTRRLPYDPNLIQVQHIQDILVNFSPFGLEPGFLAEEKTGDVLNKLSAYEGIGYEYRDTVYRGFIAERLEPLDKQNTTQKTYHASALPDWNVARPATPEALYKDVRVFCTGPQGNLLWEVFEDVPYVGDRPTPHAGRTKHIPFNDNSPNGYRNGRAHAARMALRLARMDATGEMLLPAYDPLYERGDTFRVEEDVKNRDGHTEILWGMRAEHYKHGYGADLSTSGGGESSGLLATQIAYSATVLEENTVKPPALIVPASSSGVSFEDATGHPWGSDENGDDIFFLDGIEWIAVDETEEDELIVYLDDAAYLDSQFPDELVVMDT